MLLSSFLLPFLVLTIIITIILLWWGGDGDNHSSVSIWGRTHWSVLSLALIDVVLPSAVYSPEHQADKAFSTLDSYIN